MLASSAPGAVALSMPNAHPNPNTYGKIGFFYTGSGGPGDGIRIEWYQASSGNWVNTVNNGFSFDGVVDGDLTDGTNWLIQNEINMPGGTSRPGFNIPPSTLSSQSQFRFRFISDSSGNIYATTGSTIYRFDSDGDSVVMRRTASGADSQVTLAYETDLNLSDGREVFKYGMNPKDNDSDHDFLPDWYEYHYGWNNDDSNWSTLLSVEVHPTYLKFPELCFFKIDPASSPPLGSR